MGLLTALVPTHFVCAHCRKRKKRPISKELRKGAGFKISLAPLLRGSEEDTRAVVLNLGVLTPLGIEQLFHRGRLRPSCTAYIYIVIHNNNKVTAIT